MTTDGDLSFVFLIYTDIQWGTGSQIGFNAGDGVRSFTLPGALTNLTRDIDTLSNIGVPGVFIYRVDEYPIQDLPDGTLHAFLAAQNVKVCVVNEELHIGLWGI